LMPDIDYYTIIRQPPAIFMIFHAAVAAATPALLFSPRCLLSIAVVAIVAVDRDTPISHAYALRALIDADAVTAATPPAHSWRRCDATPVVAADADDGAAYY